MQIPHSHKELQQLKNIRERKAAAIKVTTKYKNDYQILLSLKKKKNNKSDIYQGDYHIKLSILNVLIRILNILFLERLLYPVLVS